MYFFKREFENKSNAIGIDICYECIYILNLLKYKTSVYVLAERETETSAFNEIINDWDHSLIRKNQHMRNKVHVYVIYILTIITGSPLTARKSYTRTTQCAATAHPQFFFHTLKPRYNEQVRQTLFVHYIE